MSHFLNRSTVKSPVAGVSAVRPNENCVDMARRVNDTMVRQLGTTREPRHRVLKPPLG